jgi:hypothetical protein
MMHEPEPVDLSALDPERDQLRWARIVASTRSRVSAALAPRAREPDPLEVLSGWSRPIVSAAAALLLLLGAAQATLGRPDELGHRSEARRLAWLTESAVLHGRTPTAAELTGVLRRGATP